jgi:pimeloyl-ACP methyl ester carboxylesterase
MAWAPAAVRSMPPICVSQLSRTVTWHAVGKSLSEAGYFVICPDMPNHGLAGTVQNDCSAKAFAETLNETYGAMGPFDLIVGHSLAGPVVAYLLPLLEPFHTKKVVLVDPALSVVLTDGLKDSLRGERTKRALDYQAENPKWTAMDSIAKEIGGRCMADETFLRVFDVSFFVSARLA